MSTPDEDEPSVPLPNSSETDSDRQLTTSQAGPRGGIRDAAARGVAWATYRAVLVGLSCSALIPLGLVEPGLPTAAAGLGVAGSVGANVLATLISDSLNAARTRTRRRSPADPAAGDPNTQTADSPAGSASERNVSGAAFAQLVRQELADRIEQVLEAQDQQAQTLAVTLGLELELVLERIEATDVLIKEIVSTGQYQLMRELTAGFAGLGDQIAGLDPLLRGVKRVLVQVERSLAGPHLLTPLYEPLPRVVPDAWLLQPRFGVVPYLGREGLLEDLEAWCAEDRRFSIGVVSGEGGSGKSRLAAELDIRMRNRGWDAGQVTDPEALTNFTAGSATLLVVDDPERWLAVLGFVLEKLALRVAGPPVRVLLLSRQPATRSHWWRELDRTSRRAATEFADLHLDLGAHSLSPDQRQEHAETAMRAFGRHLGIHEIGAMPDLSDDDFASPLLVHVAALLAVHGQQSGTGPTDSIRQKVLENLLTREHVRWNVLLPVHQLDDLHPRHAERAVLAAVLTRPTAGEAAELLAALPELSGSGQRERRGRICYWLADLYPGERLMATFGPTCW